MLKKIREFTYRYAIVSTILIAALFVLLMNATARAFHLLPSSAPVQYAEEIFVMLYSVAIVLLLGFRSTFQFKGFFKSLLYSSAVIAFMLISLGYFFLNATSNPNTVWASSGVIVFKLVQAIGIGIREECFFRGAIQNILSKKYAHSVKGVWISALIGAASFALVHLLNIFAGYDPVIVIAQTLSAMGSGLFFVAIYLRSGNLWASALVHALIDTVALAGSIFLTQTRVDTVNSLSFGALLGTVVYIVPAVFLLRPSKCKEIVARFEASRDQNLLV